MSQRVSVPAGATMLKSYTGVIRCGPLQGRLTTISLYEGMISKGYRSRYESVPHQWLKYSIPTKDGTHRIHTFSYSGRRLEQAQVDYDSNVRQLRDADLCAGV